MTYIMSKKLIIKIILAFRIELSYIRHALIKILTFLLKAMENKKNLIPILVYFLLADVFPLTHFSRRAIPERVK